MSSSRRSFREPSARAGGGHRRHAVRRGAPALLAAALAMLAAGAPSEESAISEARLISAALEGVTGLTARFTQTLESAALPSPQVEHGVVYLLRPGRMRFEYDEPKGKLAIADGRRTWLYLPEERQALTAPLGAEGAQRGIALLLEDRIDLVSEFSVAWGPAPEGGGSRPLLLTPRSPRKEYQSLLLEPDTDHLVQALTVVDPLGGRVTYRFTHVKRSASLDPALFLFTPPPGVVVREAGS